ncbi:MAG: 30S ribosomal protein S21 [Candidatus Sumerlaeaceae bacterium]|jgi:small subunit ribosomal protein S21|nr:30S ribosomal protein S21 [Candidatus Sumerlaeaceae bacterium]
MAVVTVDQNEPIDKVLKRFKKECQKAGILSELRRREHYEKPSVRRRRKIEAARRKARRREMKLRKKLEAAG